MPITPRIIPALACLAIVWTTARGFYDSESDVKQALCNIANFDVDPFYPFTVAFLDQVVKCTRNSYNSSCSIDQTYNEGHLWGHGECSQLLKDEIGCVVCTNRAKRLLYKRCDKRAKGAQIRLWGCSLRYEAYEFTADPLS